MTPDVFTSHWRSPLLEDADAVMVSISRGQPRRSLPFRYRRLPELAPDDRAWAEETEEGFGASYARQLEELGAPAILERLERIAGGKTLVLLCWEWLADPNEWCHRRMLAAWIEQRTGLMVPELRAGMLGKRSDAPQPALFDELPRGERA